MPHPFINVSLNMNTQKRDWKDAVSTQLIKKKLLGTLVHKMQIPRALSPEILTHGCTVKPKDYHIF